MSGADHPCPETPRDAESLFDAAREIGGEGEREAFLRRSCGGDRELLDAVRSLLVDHERADALFARVEDGMRPPDELTGAELGAHELAPGDRVGACRVEKKLGEGGAGVVYQAVQERPVRRAVAIKLLKLGMDTRRVIARFEAERQTLALMEHPNIARVLDAGATETGRPYFLMELVHGRKITDYCEEAALGLPDRLRLFLQVGAGVRHAHLKGVIHRDLKPSNLLVAEIDGRPVVKVIDFGIAKALADPSRDTVQTQHDQRIGTPACMSPEQFLGIDLDTRSDIYGLGVVLYEMLAGRPPFAPEELAEGGLERLRQRILHQDPPRPSARAPRLAARLRGELDWIVMRALEKDRERRYQSVRELMEDIERYLAQEPVLARPPSRVYRFLKLLQRNKLAFAAGTVALLALVAGFTVSTALYLRARDAERQQIRLRIEAEEREAITRAAILIMQNRHAEADAEIRRIGGVLTHPSLEATSVFRQLAIWNALRGDFPSAARRLLALSRVNRFDDSDQTDAATRDLVPLAPALIEAGELEEFRAFSRLLVDRLGRTTNPIAAEHVLKCCLQLPPEPALVERLGRVADVAEQSLARGDAAAGRITDLLDAWRCAVLGLWHLRRGEDEEAVRWTTLAFTYPPGLGALRAYAHVVRGRAWRRLGQDEAGNAELAKARALIAETLARPMEFDRDGAWHDWLAVRLLLAEADPDAS